MEDDVESYGSGTRISRRLRGVAGALLMSTALFGAVACSKTPASPQVASIPTTAEPSASASASVNKGDPLAFAQCMRTNGVPNFPDPQSGHSVLPKGLDPNSATFKAASDKCKQYIAADQGAAPPAQDPWPVAEKLKYSKCMRENGLPTFPDPNKDGGLEFDNSIDPNSTQFKNAEKACSKYEPQNGGGGGS